MRRIAPADDEPASVLLEQIGAEQAQAEAEAKAALRRWVTLLSTLARKQNSKTQSQSS